MSILTNCKDVFFVEFENETNVFNTYEKAMSYARSAYLQDICKKILKSRVCSDDPNYFISEIETENMLSSLIRVPVKG